MLYLYSVDDTVTHKNNYENLLSALSSETGFLLKNNLHISREVILTSLILLQCLVPRLFAVQVYSFVHKPGISGILSVSIQLNLFAPTNTLDYAHPV